jgi:hypothetical protein
MGGWIKLHNEELHNLYCWSKYNWKQIGKVCRTHGEKRNACANLVGKPEEMGQLRKTRCKWKDCIKWDRVIWTGLMWLRLRGTR